MDKDYFRQTVLLNVYLTIFYDESLHYKFNQENCFNKLKSLLW